MVHSLTVTCLDCGYVWKPRKDSTRYQRQCPHCKSTRLDENKGAGNTLQASTPSVAPVSQNVSVRVKWPQVIYDLMGISGASSPENGIVRAFELYKLALPYKFKYNMQSLEEVFELLENRAAEASKRLRRVLDNPELIFYEIAGTDLAVADYYEAIREKGYPGTFLNFLTDIICRHFKDHGYDSPQDFRGAID